MAPACIIDSNMFILTNQIGAKYMARKATSVNLHKVKNQKAFLETYLRGTGRTLSVAQAVNNYGIAQLPARMFEMKQAGMVVKTVKNTAGNTAYRISARDENGSRSKIFA
jgi:hypothetical protein